MDRTTAQNFFLRKTAQNIVTMANVEFPILSWYQAFLVAMTYHGFQIKIVLFVLQGE